MNKTSIWELEELLNKLQEKSQAAPLVVCCPLAQQFNYGKCSNDPVSWRWKSCKHQTYINDEGDCICKNSSCDTNCFIQDVGFKCKSESHFNDYVHYKLRDVVFALQMATKAVYGMNAEDEEAMDFLENMTKSIRKKWKK